MNLTGNEKKLIKSLVEKELESVQTEDKSIIQEDFPDFLAGEEKYEEFLENLLNKL